MCDRCPMSTVPIFAVGFLLLTISATSEDSTTRMKLYWGYKLVRAFPRSQADVKNLFRIKHVDNLTVDMWRLPSRPGSSVDMAVSPRDFLKLKRLLSSCTIAYKVQISDIQAVINRQNDERNDSFSWHRTYHTFEQIVSHMKHINQTTKIVDMKSIGKSFENRDLFIMQIHADKQTKKPLVFINCGIHAREWISPATCMYVIDQIVSLYGKDTYVTDMLNKVDLTILPVLNVDGYVYSWSKERLWRKNRSFNKGSNCIGTDLNRNWQFKWGGVGASEDPCAGDYRGASPMSEKEVQSINRFLKSEVRRIAGYLDVHSYSQLWMIPWACDTTKVKDYDELIRVSEAVTKSIKSAGFNTKYEFGAPSRLLYLCTGTLQDYVYGSLGVKYSFTVELRDKGHFGFLLPSEYIEPTAKELFEGLKTMIKEISVLTMKQQQ
ncbi:carboxypeptidase A2-like [Montipora foliosa]|uniref:carboxypeptidase A2-like n=1 Tax=Montipora foliosa TaxID=591990 RepID=UPI0035F1E241